jgi:hypothetical protein
VGNWPKCGRDFKKKICTIFDKSEDDDADDNYYDDGGGGGGFEDDRNMGLVRSGDCSIFLVSSSHALSIRPDAFFV